jgi:DNA-binding transcriptional LysR family regulator
MTLEQLRIFIAVAERQQMTRAAEALNLTQQAVSAAVVTLENAKSTALFHRPPACPTRACMAAPASWRSRKSSFEPRTH